MELFKLFGRIFIDSDEANRNLNETEQNAQKFTDKLGAIGSKATAVGGVMTTAFVGVGAGLIKMASDSEAAGTRLQNQLGLSDQEAQKLKATGQDIYSSGWGESLTDVTDALAKVKQNMTGVNDSDLEKVTKSAMALAQTFDGDVNEVTRAGQNMMQNFGISSDEAFDLMAKGAQNGLNFSGELFDNLSEYSPLWSDMGYSADEMFGILVRGAENGVYNLDYMNDVMKEFQIRVKDGSKGTSDAMGQLSQSTQQVWQDFLQGKGTVADVANAVVPELQKMDDQVLAGQIGVALFGTKWEDLEADAMYAMLGTNEAMTGFAGSMDGIIEKQEETFGQRFQSLLRTTQEALLPLGNALLDVAERVLPPLIAGVTTVAEWFQNLSPTMQQTIVTVGLVGAGISALVLVFGLAASAIGGIISAVTSVVTGFSSIMTVGARLIGVFTSFNPVVVAVVAVIGTLIAIGVLLYKNWDEVSAFLQAAWEKIKQVAETVWNGLKDFFSMVWDLIVKIFMNMSPVGIIIKYWDEIKAGSEATWNKLKEFFSTITNAIKEVFSKAWESIKSTTTQVWNNIKSGLETVWNGIKSFAETLWNGLKDFFSKTWEALKTTFTNGVNAVKSGLETAWNNIKSVTESIWNGIKTFFENTWNGIKSKLETVVNAIKSFLETAWNNIKTLLSNAMNAIKSTFESVWNSIKSSIESIVNAIKSFIENTWNGIKSTISTVLNSISSTVSSVWNSIKSTISTVISGISSGISTTFNGILSTAKNIFNSVKDAMTSPIEKARDLISGAIDKIKGFFSGLSLKFPEIKMPKLPHFSLSGSFSLKPPSVPKLSVNWYKTGGIFDGDSIIGVGEAGKEAVLPLEGQHLKPWANEMAKALIDQTGGVTGGGSSSQPIIIQLDGKKIAEVVVPLIPQTIRTKTGLR